MVKLDFCVFLPRNLSSKHRAYLKEKGVPRRSDRLSNKMGLGGPWSKLNRNNQTQNRVLKSGFILNGGIYGFRGVGVAMTLLGGSGLRSSFISGYSIIVPLETELVEVTLIGRRINFI